MENGIKVSFKYSGISNFQILKYSEDVKKIHKLLEKVHQISKNLQAG